MHTQYRRFGRRPATALAALSLAGALALTGCAAGGDDKSMAKSDAAAPGQREAAGNGAAPAPAASGAPAPGADKNQPQAPAARTQIIRTATLTVETADAQKATAGARTAAENAGGYVGNETTKRDGDGVMTSTVTLRVPGERFDAVLAAMEGSGKLLDRKVEAQDVTQKVADVDSRVKSQQASVTRVREMMEKASGLSEVVTLEAELSKRQADLESLLAQQTALKDQTSLGTITLTFSEPSKQPVKAPEKPDPGFFDALVGGWAVFATAVQYLLMALAAASPFLLSGAFLALCFRQYRKWRPAKEKPDFPTARRLPAQNGPVWPGHTAATPAQPVNPARPVNPSRPGATPPPVQD
ncbi:DUF4349 domain-containing protein [Streptomyces sp. NBC_01264]|uniref:DUF4349 domain-containing protein n=1 Tax=Streptomyces sp. NBC_01264 TaxID=2903804 RepID=UPI0022512D21|nr:DUF4349 domain-containing protein [Streptomyces sp. NBC_01264]MCX4783284.1 DUF4349 domain-containing protein [Streptomyces sp. NBC_01264]